MSKVKRNSDQVEERMEGLTNRDHVDNFDMYVQLITEDLLKEGFESGDILNHLSGMLEETVERVAHQESS